VLTALTEKYARSGASPLPVLPEAIQFKCRAYFAAHARLPTAIAVMDRRTRAGEWAKEEARGVNKQLHGKRVGLVGFGAIGKALAKLLSGFDLEIVYYDPVVDPAQVDRQFSVRNVSLDELLATSDVVSLHLPLLPETTGLISEERIAHMKPGAVLINCARGGLVDERLCPAPWPAATVCGRDRCICSRAPVGSPLLAWIKRS